MRRYLKLRLPEPLPDDLVKVRHVTLRIVLIRSELSSYGATGEHSHV